MVPDLTVGAFVPCLKRFVNRKGLPYLILSDNSKTFKGKELKEVLLKSGINWRFNLAKASWTGGFFERLIRSPKRVLKKLLRNARLTYEELFTVLSEVEGILNSRPLTYLDSENLEEPLTPSHLFLGKRLLREPEYVEMKEEIIVTTENLSRRVKYLQTLLSQFWSRWRREYLSELREAHSHVARSYKSAGERFIKQDDIVLISEDRVPRNTWKVAKVESLIESKDGCVRGANVKVFSKEGKKSTIIQRPVQKLYPVEADIDLKVKEEECKRDIIKSESHDLKERPCRDAKVFGELKRKYVNT